MNVFVRNAVINQPSEYKLNQTKRVKKTFFHNYCPMTEIKFIQPQH